jgi:translation initiation factor 1
MKKNKNANIVYSSEHGRMCPDCGKPTAKCICCQKEGSPKGDGIVRLMRETKGRKGKGVSLITGVPLDDDDLRSLAKQLKQKCGSGGTIKNGVIEIQGDHRDILKEELIKMGYKVKKSGG